MRRKNILRLLAAALVVVSSTILNPIAANAEWNKDSTGWYYLQGEAFATDWKLIDGTWYYFAQDGYMQTGWTEYINFDSEGNVINSTYYYLNDDGAMDDSKTTNIRPYEIQKMYDKLMRFEVGTHRHDADLYYGDKLNNIGIDVINQIKPDFGKCSEFTVIDKFGDAEDGLCYNEDTGSLVILNQGNIIITDTNALYGDLIEKGNHVSRIRDFARTQSDYSSTVFDIKEEKNCFVIDKYEYDYKDNTKTHLVRSYVYDKLSQEIS